MNGELTLLACFVEVGRIAGANVSSACFCVSSCLVETNELLCDDSLAISHGSRRKVRCSVEDSTPDVLPRLPRTSTSRRPAVGEFSFFGLPRFRAYCGEPMLPARSKTLAFCPP